MSNILIQILDLICILQPTYNNFNGTLYTMTVHFTKKDQYIFVPVLQPEINQVILLDQTQHYYPLHQVPFHHR